MPHDIHDYDSTQVPVLLDAELGGEPRKLLLFPNRNGFYYVLDRADATYEPGKIYMGASRRVEKTRRDSCVPSTP